MPEDVLRKYRPVGPPPPLRNRIVPAGQRAWPWAVAAAALVTTTFVLHGATRSLGDESVFARPDVFGPEARVSYITHALGGGDEAVRAASLIVMEEERRTALPPVSGATAPSEPAR